MQSLKDLLIVIPARGGSKGLPGKNARTLGEIPLLGWTAEAIKYSGLSSAPCLLSTDDEKIAEIGQEVGLEVPFMRPSHLAGDHTTPDAVALHAVEWITDKIGKKPKLVMLLQPTSPFRKPESLLQSLKKIENYDAVIGVKAIYRSLHTLFFADSNMNLNPLNQDENLTCRRQDAKTIFTPNGALYLIRTEKLGGSRQFFPKSLQGIEMDQISSIDIDDSVDWKMAEALVAKKQTWRCKLL